MKNVETIQLVRKQYNCHHQKPINLGTILPQTQTHQYLCMRRKQNLICVGVLLRTISPKWLKRFIFRERLYGNINLNLTNKIIGFGSLKFLIPASSILSEKKNWHRRRIDWRWLWLKLCLAMRVLIHSQLCFSRMCWW